MFSRIAPRYDLLNRLLSVGIDKRWRKRVLRRAGSMQGKRVVDVACGTGDLSLAFIEAGADVLGVDFTWPMLVRARTKDDPKRERFLCGDAMRLPLRSASCDLASIAFGIRNVADRRGGLAELARIVAPGGQVCVLEFSMPPGAVLGWLYRFYFTRLLPLIGGVVSGDAAAYRYLPDTVLAWPSPAELQVEMEAEGLVDCGYELLTGGIACLSYGRKPGAPTEPAEGQGE